jgi:hypothetical protein
MRLTKRPEPESIQQAIKRARDNISILDQMSMQARNAAASRSKKVL